MSALTSPPAPVQAPEETAAQVARRRWRRSRAVLVAVLALLILAVVLAALHPRVTTQYLDPESPSRQGAMALAEISRQRGVPVSVARNASSAADKMRRDPAATLVVTRSDRLTTADLETLQVLPGDRLLIEPTTETLQALAPGVDMLGAAGGSTAPGCSLPAATNAGSVQFTGATYAAPAGATKCYLTDGKPSLVQLTVAGTTVTVLGSGLPLTNERLAEEGDAALGMNLLAARAGVVWLIPDLPPPGAEEAHKSFGELIPFGVKLAVLQAAIAVVLAALWRSRRLGPVVAEPLPVVVRSAETVEGRARLYRARQAVDRAAQALRGAALERIVALLGMPRSAAADPAKATEIVSAIAAHTGQDPAAIGGALYGPPPADDAQLVRLAAYLDDLERQVRNS